MDEWKEERKHNYENGRKRGRWEGSECESECNEEERNLIRRRDVLVGQLGEARWLKQNIEKRSKKVRLPTSAFSSIKEVGESADIHHSFAHA